MNGYLIIGIVAIGIVIVSSFVTIAHHFVGDKYSKACGISEGIVLVSVTIALVFLSIGIAFNITAKKDYRKLESDMQYANSLDCTVEQEKFEHNYIVVQTKGSLREMKFSLDKYGIFSLYYGIKDELDKGELVDERD